jgi:hypothetical protein
MELVTRKNKGVHARLYVGDRFTTIKNRKKMNSAPASWPRCCVTSG